MRSLHLPCTVVLNQPRSHIIPYIKKGQPSGALEELTNFAWIIPDHILRTGLPADSTSKFSTPKEGKLTFSFSWKRMTTLGAVFEKPLHMQAQIFLNLLHVETDRHRC